jgi:arylsulfatase
VAERSRSVLPIPELRQVGTVTYDAKDPDTWFQPIAPLRPPSGAPHILVILLDDVGFGASRTFGGPAATPTADRLAAGGLRFTRFHTTALCSPTRAALLSGRNHHVVGMGGITEIATSAPGYDSMRPDDCAPLAEILKLNGYSTAQFGKCHEVPVWETSPVGPFYRWPTGSGFEHFYGFLGGETNQFYPAIYEGTTAVEPDRLPSEGYHFTEDMTDHAIAWLHEQRSLAPDKPFFMYYAPGATHSPHQVPAEWLDRYRGRFDAGWDVLREETFARQKELGVIPPDAELTARPAEVPAWEDMDPAMRPVLARQMEIYAAFLEHTDFHIGRLVDALADLAALDDTLIYYIIGDNGASAEGTPNGTLNEMIILNGMPAAETPESMIARVDEFGTPTAYNHYSVSWAHGMCTPYQWTKQVASHFGGTRNPLIVHWPNGIEARGEIRQQFHHVIDVAPTILDAAGLPEPDFVNGIQQRPMDGVSMRYCLDDAAAAERRETQYFEMFCNRGIYHKGWTAVTRHSTPWLFAAKLPAFEDDVWELYDTNTDWTQAHDLAGKMPDKLRELQTLFLIEAARNNVLPLDDRRIERLNADTAGRPVLVAGPTQTLYAGMGRLTEGSVINIKNKSHTVTAEVEVTAEPANGVVIAQGGAFGGWVLHVDNGVPVYCYNLLGLTRFKIVGSAELTKGAHELRMEFAYDGGGLAKGGNVVLLLDSQRIGEGRVEATIPMAFSADETADVGRDNGSAVSDDYAPETSAFNGRVNWVRIDLTDEGYDHMITPEDRLRAAMTRQ